MKYIAYGSSLHYNTQNLHQFACWLTGHWMVTLRSTCNSSCAPPASLLGTDSGPRQSVRSCCQTFYRWSPQLSCRWCSCMERFAVRHITSPSLFSVHV